MNLVGRGLTLSFSISMLLSQETAVSPVSPGIGEPPGLLAALGQLSAGGTRRAQAAGKALSD